MTQETVQATPGHDMKAVEGLLREFVKALRAVQLYLPNNPMYENACKQLAKAFHNVWDQTDRIELLVKDSELLWEEVGVYKQESKNDGLAWLLYKDGIRGITFLPGVEETESVAFLNILNQVRTLPPESADDLLTLLWEQEFEFIRHEATELADADGDEFTKEEIDAPDSETVTAEVQRQMAEQPESNDFTTIEDSGASLLALNEEELAYLQREITREYEQDLRTNVLAILLDIFETQRNSSVRIEIAGILEKFMVHLVATGDFGAVLYLLREVATVTTRAQELTWEEKQGLENLSTKLSEPEIFAQVATGLDRNVADVREEEIEKLFSGLKPAVFEPALLALTQMQNEDTKTLLEDALIKMAIAHKDALIGALKSGDPAVLQMAVRFVKTLSTEGSVPHLRRLLRDGDDATRLEVIGALEKFATSEALDAAVVALDDKLRDVRITAARMIGQARHAPALGIIESKIGDDGPLKDADLSEKKAFFEAYGRLAGDSGITRLTPLLHTKGLLKKKVDPQVRACAAMALGEIGTPTAVETLKKVDDDKDPVVRNAVHRALEDSSK
ncbi:MAG: HEAT repeat domain-containing protein [Gemmatimonadota bacterium]|nr:HEAT repeat domain-containing protein [Gemmatimonadota bacterium]